MSSTELATVALSEWTPDLPDYQNPGLTEALNVLPVDRTYRPLPRLTAETGLVLPAPARGALRIFDTNGASRVFAGTVNGLHYTDTPASFVARYTTSGLLPQYIWQFVAFDKEMVAVHPQRRLLVGLIDTNAPFTTLAIDAPYARCAARVGNFLVTGDLDNEPVDGRVPHRIRWSGANNIRLWGTDPATQADFSDMPSEYGRVVAITGRSYGTIFQERGISRMAYEGLPRVFNIDTVEEERGAISTGAVIDLGTYVYFLSEDGVYRWNGTNAEPIGDGKVNRWLQRRLNYSARDNIVGAVDLTNNCIIWALPMGVTSDLTELLIYSYVENRFAHAAVSVQALLSNNRQPQTLDQMLGDLDQDYAESFDLNAALGGRPVLAAVNTSNQFGFFQGSNMRAEFATGVLSTPTNERLFINSVYPVVDVMEPQVSVGALTRDQMLGEAENIVPAVAQEITGECPLIAEGRYMRLTMTIPEGAVWTNAVEMRVGRKALGLR